MSRKNIPYISEVSLDISQSTDLMRYNLCYMGQPQAFHVKPLHEIRPVHSTGITAQHGAPCYISVFFLINVYQYFNHIMTNGMYG